MPRATVPSTAEAKAVHADEGGSDMNDKKRLMRQIQVFSFAVYEAALYLDGHPNDKKAMEYYNKYSDKLAELTEKYEHSFGPLTIKGNKGHAWKWTESAWPWEYSCD